jgi:hypothetical protein
MVSVPAVTMKHLLLSFLLLAGLLPASAYTDMEDGMRIFLTPDPSGFVDGPNLYTYVKQNPWTNFDPEGLNSDADQKQVEANLEGTDIGPAIIAQEQASNQTVQAGVTVAKTIQAAAELTPMQNAATAITGTDAIGNKVSGTQQAMAVVGVVTPALKGASAAVKVTEEAAIVINDTNKATTAAAKVENSAKDVAKATGAATKSSESGVVYKVPGKDTPSGDPYIGRTSHPDGPAGRGSADGRDRANAEVVDSYSTTNEGKVKEQQAMDNSGGVKNLDNKRNEIADKNRASNGLPPSKPSE